MLYTKFNTLVNSQGGFFTRLASNEFKHVFGGTCQCSCSSTINGAPSVRIFGSAKSLEGCSQVCITNSWTIDSCAVVKKEKKKEAE